MICKTMSWDTPRILSYQSAALPCSSISLQFNPFKGESRIDKSIRNDLAIAGTKQ